MGEDIHGVCGGEGGEGSGGVGEGSDEGELS